MTRSQREDQKPQQTHTQILGPSQQQIDELLTMPAPQDALSVRDASKKTGKSKQQNTKPGRDLIKQLETPFGVSFAKVTIQTASSAAKSAGKQAFAQDDRIHFAKEAVDTTDAKDKVVLAHELVHMVQKSNTSGIAMTEAELEAEAHILGSLAARGQSIAGKVKGHAARARRQFWNEPEHKLLGDRGAELASKGKPAELNAQIVRLAPDYELEYGDVTFMLGDYFESIEQMRQFAQNKKRRGPGTREELDYVREVILGGADKDLYDEKVQTAVKYRYEILAGNNATHFTDPLGQNNPRILSGGFIGEGGNRQAYRHEHMRAIKEAIQAGRNMGQTAGSEGPLKTKTLQEALAVEAGSNHFLTDAFASGHIRTPRTAMTEYWNKKVPMFKINLAGWIAEVIAKNVEVCVNVPLFAASDPTGVGYLISPSATPPVSVCASPDMIYHGANSPKKAEEKGALEVVTELLANKPLTFGDVVSGIYHDADNHEGLQVWQNGEQKMYYGDGMMQGASKAVSPEKEQALANQQADILEAIDLSIDDVQKAYELAQLGQPEDEILAKLAPQGMFDAERLWPQSVERAQDFEKASIEELFLDPEFQKGVRIFMEEKADIILENVPEEHKQLVKTHITDPLKNGDPIEVLLTVINWTPNIGGGYLGTRQDDSAMDYVRQTKQKKNGLCSLTDIQRANLQEAIGTAQVSIEEALAKQDLRDTENCKP